jgi:hypothetical protein
MNAHRENKFIEFAVGDHLVKDDIVSCNKSAHEVAGGYILDV